MPTSPSPVERWISAAGDLLLGARCHGCDGAWWGVCPVCRDQLAERRPRWARPDPCPEGFPRTVASSAYDPLLRGLINAHKERQALGLTPVLGRRLAYSVQALLRAGGVAPGATVSLVPVPSAARAVRERGFDATAALARTAARQLRPLKGRYDERAQVVGGQPVDGQFGRYGVRQLLVRGQAGGSPRAQQVFGVHRRDERDVGQAAGLQVGA